ncbi:MAG: DNA internalization-related competence protein ComEC/Rec2 [Burkholderiales bacterium RIFOXYC12_FULL_60_6]|nr:MAG: DNA internalization-related competence protein ComEC/Rec2 [Burkholderiales bacterium RIFOXYD12_FULL_59_19]OGB82928.1 MAG: DNA internalization-related competence protein ComEC/Rec2 [Burkholderiales bacterium RIFOXYC12_FULL_60_6]
MRVASPHFAATTSLMPVLLGVLLGNALQLQQAALMSANAYLLGCVLGLLLLGLSLRRRWSAVSWGLIGVACAVLAFASTGWRAQYFAGQALSPALEGRDIAVIGVVAAMPQHFEGGVRFRLDLESASLAGQPLRLPPRLELGWYAGVFARGDGPGELLGELQRLPAPLQAGERWHMTVRLKAPHGAVNPHGFDHELWQWEQGVQATGYVRAGPRDPPPERLEFTWQHPVQWARGQVRDQILLRLAESPSAGLIAALVVGDQAAIDRADWDVFRATGVAHLMSISGLHITMFAWASALALGWLWRRSARLCLCWPAPTAALLGGMALATAYALFSGWGVPAQRTVLMLATVGSLRLLGLRWPWPQVWLLACAVVVLLDPWALLQAGFWLSFVAVGVLFATDAGLAPASSIGIRARLLALLREQWVITLALTPLSLLLFGQVSLVGLLANALAIPWVTLVVTPLAMLGVLLHPLWDLAAGAIGMLAQLLHGLAQWPWASVSLAQAPWWAGVAGVLGGLVLALRLPWPLRLGGVPLLLPVLFWQAPVIAVNEFSLLGADIGQGNAVLVRTAHHALLYDAGPAYSRESDAGHRVLVPLMRSLGVRLDMLVLSHRDTDHTGGARTVFAAQPQAKLLAALEPGHALLALWPASRCEAGQRWQWDGVDFEVLHPLATDYGDVRKTNAISCSLRISNGAHAALLVGDIEQAQEGQLVARAEAGASLPNYPSGRLRADVLLVPHHGSKTSSTTAFLAAVQPRFAILQAGYRNRFGHPASPVLVRYAAHGVNIFDTPHCGAASWQSWEPDKVQCAREVQKRYWHHVPVS